MSFYIDVSPHTDTHPHIRLHIHTYIYAKIITELCEITFPTFTKMTYDFLLYLLIHRIEFLNRKIDLLSQNDQLIYHSSFYDTYPNE